MAGKREKPEEIVSKLRRVKVLQGQGATIAEACMLPSPTLCAFHPAQLIQP